MTTPRTLAEKVWDDHVVAKGDDGNPDLIYIAESPSVADNGQPVSASRPL